MDDSTAAHPSQHGFLIPDRYVLEPVTRQDITIASLAWGFTIGFGWLTTWTALKQTKQMVVRHGAARTLRNAYIWMIWLEILVCLIFGVICFLYLLDVIAPSFEFYFAILTTWALQVQFLLQIIVNRCGILLTDPKKAVRLKIAVAVLITLVNISVYNIWIPARLQISDRYVWINEWWDRIEKGIYLLVDAALNFYFIAIVKRNLVMHGLTKYRTLMRFNMFIVGFSLSMDVLIIAMMSLPNTFVYMQFHPLAYIVKLNIEMSMADLIGKIARNRHCGVISEGDFSASVGSGPPTARGHGSGYGRGSALNSRNRECQCGSANPGDLEAGGGACRRHQYVTFELRSDVDAAGADAQRSRKRDDDNDDDKACGPPSRPREFFSFGTYGAGLRSKFVSGHNQHQHQQPHLSVSRVKREESASSGSGTATSFGDADEAIWVEEEITPVPYVIPPPPQFREGRVPRRLRGHPRPGSGRSRSLSPGGRGWSPFRRTPHP